MMPLEILKNIKDFIYQKAFRYKHGVIWLLAVVVAAIIIMLYQSGALSRLELFTLDYRFALKHYKLSQSDIVFIDMAEDSIEAIGRWPWPRSWHAAFVKILSEYRPKAIAFDVIFSEPQDKTDDLAFEEAIRWSGMVYLPLLYDLKAQGVVSVLESLPDFRKWIRGSGHINATPDQDGILRRMPPVMSYKDRTTYQFGLKIGFDILGLKDEDIYFDPQKHLMILKIADKTTKVRLDDNNQLLINWQGRWGQAFNHFSYIDVIRSYALIKEGKKPIIDLDKFRDKICIVGLTAAGLTDIKPIPIQNAYPAVGVNAMAVNSVITNDFMQNAPRVINMLIIVIVSLFITIFLSNIRLLSGMVFAIISAISYFLFSVALFNLFNIVIATFYPILAILVSYSLTSVYTQILQAVERAHLFRQATRDGLTGLYNIRHFNLLLEAEFKNVALYKFRRLALIMGDVDNFKHLNDTYGHPAGDAILREVAKIMQTKCRQTDVVARYGGEEFIVMLTGAGEKEAFNVADGIRKAIEAKKFRFKGDTYAPTISIGAVEYSNEKTKDELVEKADKALYKAKHEGKNRVCTYSSITQ